MRSPIVPPSLDFGLSNSCVLEMSSLDYHTVGFRIEPFLDNMKLPANFIGKEEKITSRLTAQTNEWTKEDREGRAALRARVSKIRKEQSISEKGGDKQSGRLRRNIRYKARGIMAG